jgi:hypothetical protein
MMVFFNKVSNTFTKYYYLYFHNNDKNVYSHEDIEIPVLKREQANADLALLIV